MREIDLYNESLQNCGLDTINAINTYDPDVARIKTIKDDVTLEILSNYGWRFNNDKITLSPDPNNDDKISVEGYLFVKLPAGFEHVIARDNVLWDTENQVFWTSAINNVEVTTGATWANLPDHFQRWISARTALRFLLNVKGADARYSILSQREYDMACAAENLYPVDYGKGNGATALDAKYYL